MLADDFLNPKYMLVAGLFAAIVFVSQQKSLARISDGRRFLDRHVVFLSAPQDGGAVASWFEAPWRTLFLRSASSAPNVYLYISACSVYPEYAVRIP